MDLVSELLAKVGGVAAIVLIVIGAVWIAFKDILTSWLTRRVSKSLERDADHYRHELAREMEKFKDELSRVQSAERFKAEARRAVADRVLDRRISAYHDINVALIETPSWIVSQMSISPAGRRPITEYFKKIEEMGMALSSNGLYFDNKFSLDYRTLIVKIQAVASGWLGEELFDVSGEKAREIQRDTAALSSRLDEMFQRLPDDVVKIIAGG